MNRSEPLPPAPIRQWTALGRRRKELEVRALTRTFHEKLADSASSTPSSQEQQSDYAVRRADRNDAFNRMTLAEHDLAGIRIAPQPSLSKKTGQTGHQFRICYVSHPDPMKVGTEESMILGGVDEQWEEGDVRVIRCNSPLGKALVGAEKGDERTVEYPDYAAQIEIVDMAVPNLDKLGSIVHRRVKERLDLPNGEDLHV